MSDKKVIVFSSPHWGPCTSAKEFLSSKGVEYQEKNIATDPEAQMELVQTYKSMGTPTIVVGDKVIVGFRQAEIEAALAGWDRCLVTRYEIFCSAPMGPEFHFYWEG